MIKLHDIHKTYTLDHGEQVEALRGIDLEVQRGEIFGVIGLSGAGKSTLIRIINMLERPTRGSVMVNGRELTTLNERELRAVRRRIGMIFQSFNLLSSCTVRRNVAFALELDGRPERAKVDARVDELLELVGLADKAEAYPAQLSGGQKQRVGIARALASEPEILLCDEATSALDPQTTRSILDLLRQLRRRLNLTIMIITHQMEVIKECCDRVAVISDGVIAELGDTLEIFASPRQELTRRLVAAAVRQDLDDTLLSKRLLPDYVPGARAIVELVFLGERANDPVVAEVCVSCRVRISILAGSIHHIHERPLGFLSVAVEGSHEAQEQALKALRERVYRMQMWGWEAPAGEGDPGEERPVAAPLSEKS